MADAIKQSDYTFANAMQQMSQSISQCKLRVKLSSRKIIQQPTVNHILVIILVKIIIITLARISSVLKCLIYNQVVVVVKIVLNLILIRLSKVRATVTIIVF